MLVVVLEPIVRLACFGLALLVVLTIILVMALCAIAMANRMADRSASEWLKMALRGALNRDPVDALNDALALAGILENRLRVELDLDDPL